nr:hypothetical protein [uncultured Cohaesibacter sp.]
MDSIYIMPLILRAIFPFLIALSSMTVSAAACLEDKNPAPSEISDAVHTRFVKGLSDMKMETFVTRYCGLKGEDRGFAEKLFGSAYEGLDQDEEFTLLRMSIMVPDIEESVNWVIENARLKEDGDEWESISLKRFVTNVRTRFPATRSVLDGAYLNRIEALFQSAVDAIRNNEDAADRKISEVDAKIADYEKQIDELRWRVESLKDERRDYRVMRQTLEAEQ